MSDSDVYRRQQDGSTLKGLYNVGAEEPCES